MVHRKINRQTSGSESGFALLMTLIVVGVVVSIGLSVLDLSIKQIRLSTDAKDSERAFHAANAGMECARYIRRVNSDSMESGASISPSCFGVSAGSILTTNIPSSNITGAGSAYLYEYSLTWGTAPNQRCSKITSMVSVPNPLGVGATTTNMTTYIPGYPQNSWGCRAGERCSVLSARGYNRPCNSISNYGTIEREVLLQF